MIGKVNRKEGIEMKLIWKSLLHANFRCGRMCCDRADLLAENGALPSGMRMCTRV